VPLQGFASLIPPLSVAAWLATRPFVKSWLSVVQFFLLESFFVALLTGAILWWIRPILRSVIQLVEIGIKPLLPLDSVLVGRRMRLTSHKVTFTVAGVTLVFSLLTALHDITGALKGEIHRWAEEALYPYVYLQRVPKVSLDQGALELALQHNGIQLFRMSAKARGEFPVRLIAAADINPYRTAAGKRPLVPNTTILSRTLAARFGVRPGDWLIIDTSAERHRFELIDVSDDVGFYAEDGQYVDLKSYVLFAEGNPLFFSTLERSLGRYAMARKTDGSGFSSQDIDALLPYYHLTRRGTNLGNWQKAEIDRDFLIFDFVLFTTVVLAAVGVANSILIQVLARERELAVLRTLGVSRLQTMRLLLIEGVVIGLVSAFLALILGNVIGAISISFLDRFTLFEYRFAFSLVDSAIISLLTVSTCTLAAIYPALVANRISSAESLHYE
jgi:putative ABC transport system permease protein